MIRNKKLSCQLRAIQSLINTTDKATQSNVNLQKHWGRYLCILAAGFLENAMREVYIDFVSKRSNLEISNFIHHVLNKISNPKSEKFKQTAGAFKQEWAQELEEFFKENSEVRDAIDSIMNNRNQIAHGKNQSISVVQVRDYLNRSVKAIEFIENQCFKKGQ